MPSQAEIQRQITDRIIEGLKNGVIPWKKQWRNDPNCGAPTNVISNKPYNGINPILLDLVAMSRGFQSKWWGTYAQWKVLGASVRKRPDDVKPGHWGTNIVFYRQVEKTKTDDSGETTKERFPLLRYFTVFNAEQVDGIVPEKLRPSTRSISTALDADYAPAQTAIGATGADIRYGGDQAFYVRPIGPAFPNHTDGDYIWLPPRDQFDSPHEFFATSMHELCHWSECRRNWTGSYAMGELIAEIGACFLCAQVGIPCSDKMDNHVAYLGEWLKDLQNDDRAILKAASQASKAAEFVLSFSRPLQPATEELQTA